MSTTLRRGGPIANGEIASATARARSAFASLECAGERLQPQRMEHLEAARRYAQKVIRHVDAALEADRTGA